MARLKALKGLSVLVALALVLSLGIITLPMTGMVAASPGEWYVDGTLGTDDGTHGTGPEANAFKTIQYAIDDARVTDGDTISVAPGTYIENAETWCDINLDKDVSLIGAGSGSTIIELNDTKSEGLQIKGDSGNPSDITIEGITFTIPSGSTDAVDRALRVFDNLNSLTLLDVEVEYAEVNNVEIDGDINVLTIDECNFHHADEYGLVSPGAILSGTITNSHFDNNGLDVPASGMHLFGSTTNLLVTDCSMNNNGDSGFNATELTNVTFRNVTASNNSHASGGYGIAISEKTGSSFNITLENITAENNGRDGILVWTWYDVCSISTVTIRGGLFTNNGWAGIRVTNYPLDSIGGRFHNITVTHAQIENNPNAGVWFDLDYKGSDAVGSHVNCNNIVGNTNWGVLNSGAGTLDAKNNWWGDASGPSHSPGTGDKVSDNVTYAPWLPMEFQYCPECGGTPPVPVGGEAYPVNKLAILALWIATTMLLGGGMIWYALRRRKV